MDLQGVIQHIRNVEWAARHLDQGTTSLNADTLKEWADSLEKYGRPAAKITSFEDVLDTIGKPRLWSDAE